jgi:TetR/AcrR family transcriptional regulator, mexCD-oprJ operon repressor
MQERVAAAILDVAADLLARGGEPPSMAQIAAAAGVSRATLYRYFPTRERLLQALIAAGLEAAATGLAQAGLDTVPVPEAIARLVRLVAAAGSKYAAVVSAFDPAGPVEQQIGAMIEALLRRGLDDGTFRADLSVEDLGFVLGQLLQAAGRMAAEQQAGVEKAAALITTVFLHGTANRETAGPDDTAAGRRAAPG